MIRQLLYFVVGLLLGATVVLAHAETINATAVPSGTSTPRAKVFAKWNTTTPSYSTVAEVCDAYRSTASQNKGSCADTIGTWSSYGSAGDCKYQPSNTNSCISSGTPQGVYAGCPAGSMISGANCVTTQTTYTCPDSSWTLSGQTCTRANSCPTYPPSTPDSLSATQPSNCSCPAGTSWYAYNGCRKTCGGNQPTGEVANSGFGIAIADGATEGCFQGCLVQHKAGGYDQYKGYKMATATWSKWACNGNGLGTGPTPNDQPTPDAQTQDPSKKKDPPCAAGDGVITSSSGGVKCLPEGTPNTSKPSVEKKTKTETFPDNSTKTTTETTTRDPNTNATSVSTTTTSTGGQSGPAGTSTSQEGTTGKVGGGNGNGDGDGSCDPTLNFCGGPSTDDLYKKKDKTMESVLGKFKDDVANTEFAKGAGAFFNVTIPGGSCGGMSANVPYLNMTVDLGQFLCTPQAAQLLEGVGAVLRVVVAFLAFTWAFL